MLSISYAQCLADPTYCDTGKRGGAALVKKFAVKPNEPRPLAQIFPWLTVAELLWLLRAVKASQKEEAHMVAVCFCIGVLRTLPQWKEGGDQLSKAEILQRKAEAASDCDRKQYWAIERWISRDPISQIAIDIAEAGLAVASFAGPEAMRGEEQRQRNHLMELLQ